MVSIAGDSSIIKGARRNSPEEPVMGILSWFRRKSLVRTNVESEKLQRVEDAAAADVAAIEQDDKYFDPDSPGQQDGL
jgi:hypothetical protein